MVNLVGDVDITGEKLTGETVVTLAVEAEVENEEVHVGQREGETPTRRRLRGKQPGAAGITFSTYMVKIAMRTKYQTPTRG